MACILCTAPTQQEIKKRLNGRGAVYYALRKADRQTTRLTHLTTNMREFVRLHAPLGAEDAHSCAEQALCE
jgi:hypothetical protein